MGKANIDRHLRQKSKSLKKDESFCQWCETTFPGFEEHSEHTCLPNRCSLCNTCFKDELQLIKHKKSDHDNAPSRSMKETGDPLPGKLYLRADHVSPGGKRTCKMCNKNLRGRHEFCTSCMSPTNKDTDDNLSDEYSIISSSILSSSNHNSSLLDKTTKSGNLFRCSRRMSSSNSSEVSRCSDSLEIKKTEDAAYAINNAKKISLSVLPGITTAHESPSRRSRRADRFCSNSSEISSRSESLDAKDSDVVNNKKEASITSLLNKNITEEKFSRNRHKRAKIRSGSSEICKHSESEESQKTEDAIKDGAVKTHDAKEKETNDALKTKVKQTTKCFPKKTKRSGIVSQRIIKQSAVSSNTSDVSRQSESVEPMISEDAISNGCLDANGTKNTKPLLNETTIVENIVAHNHKRGSKSSGNSEISNMAPDADPLEIQKSGDSISSDVVNGETVQKPTEQNEKEETVTGSDLNKTVSVFTNSFKPMDMVEKHGKSKNSIFYTKKIMPQKPDMLLTSDNQGNCPESNTNEKPSMSITSLKQVKNSVVSGNVITVGELPSHKSSEKLVDPEGETVAISEVNEPASVLTKSKRVRYLKKERSQREQNASTSLGRVGRKRNIESDDGNYVSPSRNKSDSIEEHTSRRTSKKIKNTLIDAAPASYMVQIDTLIRSLPDDSGILLKPCGKDDSNFKCPKCNKVFRNPKLGSVHYSICPKNIELSKNRKTLVSPCNVVWVCSLCHVYFNQHSKLTKHKEICLLPMSSKLTFRSSLLGDEYKSSCKKCPKCCYQCISLINFQSHPCKENLKKMKSCAIEMDKLPALYINSRGNFQYFECHQCKKPFFDEPSFQEHLQLHPAARSSEYIKTLNIKSGYPTTQIKAEVISIDDDKHANDNEQSTSNATLNSHLTPGIPSSTFARPQNQSPITNSLHSRGSVPSSNHQREGANNPYLETFFSPASSSTFSHPLDASRMPAETQVRDIFTEDFLSSAQAKVLNFHLMNRGICLHRRQADLPGEDVKPCIRCLEETIGPDASHDIAKVKQEMVEAVRRTLDNHEEEDVLEIDEAPLTRDPDPPNPLHRDLDLLGYGNSEVAMQLMKDINAIPIPLSSHRFLTPPATPDRSNVRSPPSLGFAHKKSRTQSGDCEAGPSSLNNSHSLNDLVSISLDKPFTTSEGFIAPFNEDAQSYSAESLSEAVNDPVAPDPALMATKPMQMVDEPVPMADEPMLIVGEPVPMADEPMPMIAEPVPLVDEPVVQELFPALEIDPPPTVRHTDVPFGDLVADAFAIISNGDTETVNRYICRHCLLTFQLDTLVTHMYSKAGKPTTEDIIAVYIVE